MALHELRLIARQWIEDLGQDVARDEWGREGWELHPDLTETEAIRVGELIRSAEVTVGWAD